MRKLRLSGSMTTLLSRKPLVEVTAERIVEKHGKLPEIMSITKI